MFDNAFGPTAKTAAFAAFERVVNTALRLDPASQQQLAALAGQVFHLECTRPALDIFLLPHSDGVQLAAHWSGDITAALSGSGKDYAELLHSNDPGATLINGNMTVRGDSKALLKLRDIAATLDLDWEAPLTRIFGDVIGHQFAQSLRFGQRLLSDMTSSLRRQLRDYAQEENPYLARRAQADQFRADVAQLHTRTEQLLVRAARLQQRLTEHGARQ
jgi:ubiquinone biosynthesis protein UbiJ